MNKIAKNIKDEMNKRLFLELEKVNLDAAKELVTLKEYWNWQIIAIPDNMSELEAHFVIKTYQGEVVIAQDDASSGPRSEVVSKRDYERKYRKYLEGMIPEIVGLPYEDGYTGAGAFSEAELKNNEYSIWHLSNFV